MEDLCEARLKCTPKLSNTAAQHGADSQCPEAGVLEDEVIPRGADGDEEEHVHVHSRGPGCCASGEANGLKPEPKRT